MTALREVLGARAIPAKRLEKSGLSQQRIIELLSDAEPTVEEVRILAKHLRLPARELIIGLPKNVGTFKLRTNFGKDVSSELQFEAAHATYRARRVAQFSGLTSLPTFVDYPKSVASAEELAGMFRSEILGVEERRPLLDLHVLLWHRLRVPVIIASLRSIEGVSTRAFDSAVVLLAPRHDGRMRFTLCHEICHLLVDLQASGNEVWLDEKVTIVRKGGDNNIEEAFANAFAAALLLPIRGVTAALKEWRALHEVPEQGITALEIMQLARTFGASFQVAASRLESIELLPLGSAVALQRALDREYGSPEKFAELHGLGSTREVSWDASAKLVMRELGPSFSDGSISREVASETLGLTLEQSMAVWDAQRHH